MLGAGSVDSGARSGVVSDTVVSLLSTPSSSCVGGMAGSNVESDVRVR